MNPRVKGMFRSLRVVAVLVAAMTVAGAASSVFATAEPGMWELTRSGSQPVRICVANPEALAQFEHRNSKCTRSVIRDNGLQATVHYSCGGGGDFGQSDVALVTPRSLTIRTQGISGSAPFKYTLQARRTGDCTK